MEKKKRKETAESPAIYVNHQPLVRVSAPGNSIPGHKLRVQKPWVLTPLCSSGIVLTNDSTGEKETGALADVETKD